ncbi:MAG TPA: VWA domain-containing protein [Candidatus Acidoferrum sp.]|nr:VWA domain-containing protein [Candidatus Acidoferrum sp.]
MENYEDEGRKMSERCDKRYKRIYWRWGVILGAAIALGLVATALAHAQAQGQQQAKTEPTAQAAAQAGPQTPAKAQGPPIKVQANLVTVYATVKDKHGKIVPNLTKDQFALTEDGSPQTITYFVADTDVPLTLGLLVDTSLSQRNVLGQEREASQKFLDDMLRVDRDKAFVIHFDRDVELLQDLTNSKEKLEKALEDLGMPELSRSDGDERPVYMGADFAPQYQGHHGGGGTTLYDAVYLASNELMKKQKGRKAVIILSDGVDRGSKVSMEEAIDAAQHADTQIYSILFADEEAYENHGGFSHGGWGHGGGMGGPGGQWPGSGRPPQQERPDGKKVLERLSSATGGEMFKVSKKETVDDIYAKIAEELRNQYSLGYVPSGTEPGGGFHKIVLTTTDKGLVVQAREGYYSEK